MAKCLILGGAGFIGSNLAKALHARGDSVRILTRPSTSIANIEAILDQVDVRYGDMMDDVLLRRATEGIDVVFHLVSTTFPSMTIDSSVYDVMSNLLPTIRLVESCIAHGVKKIVYASSGGTIYGEPKTPLISEDHPLVPQSAYGQSKLTIENYLNFYARSTHLDINVLRISNPYGPGQKLFGVQGLVAVCMGCTLFDRTLKIYGTGDSVRDYIYIDCVIDAITRIANAKGSSVVNISSATGKSILDIVKAVEAVSGRTIRKEYISLRLGDVEKNVLSNQKARALYGWEPKVTLESGLALTWNALTAKI
jgi:UDP-glucose 4-epimerase